jgi:molecular chaperone GrpE (heat shock protein)
MSNHRSHDNEGRDNPNAPNSKESPKESSKEDSKEPKKVIIEFDRGARSPGDPDTAAQAPDVPDAPETTAGPLAAQLARLKAEKDELMQTLVRRQADFENYRKRIEREREEEHRRGVGRLIGELLPMLDAFDRALKAHDDPAYEEYRKGLEIIYRQLWDTLAKHGVERIAAEGATFDPHFHQAVERVETPDYPDGAIVEVLQDGYIFHGRVLRPSIVRVAVHSGATGDRPSAARYGTN